MDPYVMIVFILVFNQSDWTRKLPFHMQILWINSLLYQKTPCLKPMLHFSIHYANNPLMASDILLMQFYFANLQAAFTLYRTGIHKGSAIFLCRLKPLLITLQSVFLWWPRSWSDSPLALGTCALGSRSSR